METHCKPGATVTSDVTPEDFLQSVSIPEPISNKNSRLAISEHSLTEKDQISNSVQPKPCYSLQHSLDAGNAQDSDIDGGTRAQAELTEIRRALSTVCSIVSKSAPTEHEQKRSFDGGKGESMEADPSIEPRQKKKKTGKEPAAKATVSSEEKKFHIGKMKYVAVNKYRGKKLVQIREYYIDDNESIKPGCKGIALNEEQWSRLKDVINDVDDALKN